MRKTFSLALAALMFMTVIPQTASAQGGNSKTAIELFKVMELPNMMKDLTSTNTDQLIQSYPALKASRKELEKFFEETVGYAALETDLAAIYASAFTESELKELITFYKTPTGRKSTREMPKLYALGADLGRRKVEARQEELQRIVTQAMQPASNATTPAKKKGK